MSFLSFLHLIPFFPFHPEGFRHGGMGYHTLLHVDAEAISVSLPAAFFTPRTLWLDVREGRVVRAKVDVLGTDAGMFGTA
jgi:hypothetical protein